MIESGLKEGDWVVVGGLPQIRPVVAETEQGDDAGACPARTSPRQRRKSPATAAAGKSRKDREPAARGKK